MPGSRRSPPRHGPAVPTPSCAAGCSSRATRPPPARARRWCPALGQQLVEPVGRRPCAALSCAAAAAIVSLLASSPCTPSRRISHGSVSPCSSSVPITTTNVRNTRCGRPGKGAPDSVVSGTPNAAANDTTPRMPAQATTNTCAGGRRRFASTDPRRQHPGQVGEQIHPDDPDDDHRRQHGCRRDRDHRGGDALQLADHLSAAATRSSGTRTTREPAAWPSTPRSPAAGSRSSPWWSAGRGSARRRRPRSPRSRASPRRPGR